MSEAAACRSTVPRITTSHEMNWVGACKGENEGELAVRVRRRAHRDDGARRRRAARGPGSEVSTTPATWSSRTRRTRTSSSRASIARDGRSYESCHPEPFVASRLRTAQRGICFSLLRSPACSRNVPRLGSSGVGARATGRHEHAHATPSSAMDGSCCSTERTSSQWRAYQWPPRECGRRRIRSARAGP